MSMGTVLGLKASYILNDSFRITTRKGSGLFFFEINEGKPS
jgi:hypothetical protein